MTAVPCGASSSAPSMVRSSHSLAGSPRMITTSGSASDPPPQPASASPATTTQRFAMPSLYREGHPRERPSMGMKRLILAFAAVLWCGCTDDVDVSAYAVDVDHSG